MSSEIFTLRHKLLNGYSNGDTYGWKSYFTSNQEIQDCVKDMQNSAHQLSYYVRHFTDGITTDNKYVKFFPTEKKAYHFQRSVVNRAIRYFYDFDTHVNSKGSHSYSSYKYCCDKHPSLKGSSFAKIANEATLYNMLLKMVINETEIVPMTLTPAAPVDMKLVLPKAVAKALGI